MRAKLRVWSGIPGGGKTTGVRYHHSRYGIPAGSKISDRRPRPDHLVIQGAGETRVVSAAGFDVLAAQPRVLTYLYRGSRYLCSLDELIELLARDRVVNVVLCHGPTVERLADALATVADVERVHVHATPEIVRRRLSAVGASQREISERLQGWQEGEQGFRANPSLYHVLDNTRDWKWFEQQLQEFVRQNAPAEVVRG